MGRIKRIVGHPAVRLGYFGLLLAAGGYYLYRWGDRLPDLLGRVQPLWAVAALMVTVAAAFLYSLIQYRIYRRLDAPVTYRLTFRIVTISQLGKYLPGKVMFAGNFYLLSRAAGIGNAQIGAAFVISQAMWMLTASLCALPVLSLLNPTLRYLVVLLPLPLLLLLYPRFLRRLLQLGQRLVGQRQAEPTLLSGLEPLFYLQIATMYLLNWSLAGLATWFSLRAFGPVGRDMFPLALASVALGTVAGFVALFAPVGLGIREGVGAVVLAPALGPEAALLALLLLRGITVIVDLGTALASMATGSGR